MLDEIKVMWRFQFYFFTKLCKLTSGTIALADNFIKLAIPCSNISLNFVCMDCRNKVVMFR